MRKKEDCLHSTIVVCCVEPHDNLKLASRNCTANYHIAYLQVSLADRKFETSSILKQSFIQNVLSPNGLVYIDALSWYFSFY